MKRKLSLVVCGTLAVVLSVSCMGPSAKRGTVIGGAVGAGTGAIIGNQSGNAGEGALIGAAAGALGGGLLGSARDDERAMQKNDPGPPPSRRGDPGPPRY